MLTVREVKLAEDYPEICEWWRQWSLLVPSQPWKYVRWDKLPPIKLIVCNGEEKLCAGFLYRADAKWSFLEWIVTNPKVTKETRGEALDELLGAATFIAKEYGWDIFSSLNHPGLVSRFEKAGFIKGEDGMTNMVWKGIQ